MNKGDGMAEVTSADREKAAKITGCKREVSRYDAQFVYCGEHDGLGNPEWDSCLWVPVAAALAEEREKARAQGYDDGYTDGHSDGFAEGMGDV